MKNMLKRFLALMLAACMLVTSATCAQAATFTLPSSLKTIETEAFEGSVLLDQVVLPEGITSIGSRAFANSTLTSINLPRSITSIAADAFANSPNVKAIVKSGSYAHTFCAENGVAYEVETVVLPSSGVPVSVSTTQTSVAMGEDLKLTFTSDNGAELSGDQWLTFSVVYLNAEGEVIGAENYGSDELGTLYIPTEYAGTAKILVTVTNAEGVSPGANPSVEVEVTGGDSYVYYEYNVDGYGYPGGTMRASVVAMNADKMTGTQNVTITDVAGSFTKTGTLSADNPKFITDFTVPASWDFYDDEGNYQEYYLIMTVGDYTRRYYANVEPFCSDYMDVPVGGTTEFSARIVPSEMPYTYSVADTSIAAVNEYGIEGLKVGTTTGTLTTKSGIAVNFTIEVSDFSEGEGEASPSEPVFYVAAAQEAVVKGDDVAMFYIYSETEDSLRLSEDIDIVLNFYNEDEEYVDSIYTSQWINAEDHETLWAEWQWWDDMLGDAEYRYIEFAFDTSYEVIEPSTARVEVISPEEMGRLAFSMNNNWGRYSAGDTVTIPLTCTTPNLLAAKAAEGDVTVKPLALYTGGLDVINNVTVASFDADTQTASVSFTVGEDVVPGENYEIYLYCGSYQVGRYSLQIHSGLTRLAYNVSMLVGESRKLPITVADGADLDNLYFYVYEPSVLSVDENGVATALSEGYTEIEVYYECAYGNTDNEWLSVEVYEAAGESLPVLTVTPKAESVVFGETIPVELKLSETITDENGNPAYVGIELMTMFLDKNKTLLTNNGSWCQYTADQFTGDGVTYNLKAWISGDDVYDVAYMVVVPRYGNGEGTYTLDYDYTIIPVTGVPERGEVLYSAQLNNSGSISQGDWVGIQVYRLPRSIGSDAEISICDAEGNVLSTSTYPDGDYSSYLSFESDDFAVGETHTVYLYVDGEKVEGGEVSFYVEEPQVHLSLDTRMAVGNASTLSYYYNAEYDCEVSFSTSDDTIASIGENNVLTALQAGTVTITASCEHGKSESKTLTVYNPDSSYVPEVYITFNDEYNIEWMGSFPVIVGVEGDLTQIPSNNLYIDYNIQLIDADGNVLYDRYEENGWYDSLYHSLEYAENELWWSDNNIWLMAAELNASYFVFDISNVDSDSYTADASRSAVLIEIPPLDEYPNPVVTVDYPSSIQQGGTIDVTFTCLNPNSLTRSREVCIEDYYEGTTLVSGYLTAETPVVTLSHDPGEDFSTGRFRYRYPVYEDGTRSGSFYVTVSAYTGLGYDMKLSVDGKNYVYPEYSGSYPALTVTSSDESVATAELYGSYAMSGMARDGGYVIVTGVGAGTAVITGTDTNGVSHSFTVVVYDSSSAVTPVLGIDQNQGGEVQWKDYHTLTVVAADEPHTFGRPSLNIQKEYLDADGNVLLTTEVAMQTENGFFSQTETAEVYVDVATMAGLYAEGARSIRFTLTAGSYTVDENAASITLPIADPSLSEEPIIYYDMPDYSCAGNTFDVTFACMNPDKLGEGVVCYAKGADDDDYASVTLTQDSPSASISITVPADRTGYSSYTTYVRIGEDGSTNYVYVTLLRGSFSSYSNTLRIGSSTTFSFYNRNVVEGLTEVWESSNPEVATVDQEGYVTAVAAGQTNIMVHYGPLTLSSPLRVYDPNIEYIEPELYIRGDEGQVAKLYNNVYAYIGTTSDVTQLGSSVSATYEIDYLDENGAVVYRADSSYGKTLYFASGSEEKFEYYINNTLAHAVAAGATQIRFSLDDTYASYTIDPERASVTIPIQDPSVWGNNLFGFSDAVVYRGENTIHMKLISVNSAYAETDCLITMNVTDQNGDYLLEGATATVNMATNPDAYFTFTVPETATNVIYYYTYQFANGGTSSNSISPKLVYVTQAQADATLALEETMTAEYYGNYLSLAGISYESSNPEIATVDDEGVVTAVSVGVTTITAHIGKLEYTFDVRVYDPEGEYATPELYLTADSDQVVSADANVTLTFGTTTDVTQLGASVYVQVYREYLNEEGEVVYTGSSSGHWIGFASRNETTAMVYGSSSEINYALASGATQARFFIKGLTGDYTVDAARAGTVLPLEDPSLRTYTSVSWSRKNYVTPGQEVTLDVSLLSLSESDADTNFICSLYVYDSYSNYLINYEEQTINSENPTASYTFTIPETGSSSYYYAGYSVKRENSSYASYSGNNTIYTTYFTSTQSDILLQPGNQQQASYSGQNLYNFTATYESSNSEVATVDAYGYVTAVAEGVATITVQYGPLTDTFNVRVYDPNGEFATPELYLALGETQAIIPGVATKLIVGTTTDYMQIAGYPYVRITYEYQNAAGEKVGSSTYSSSLYTYFVTSQESAISLSNNRSELETMYMNGARQICYTLYDGSSDYTVEAERASIAIPIAEPSTWNYDSFGWDMPEYPCSGEMTVSIRQLATTQAHADSNFICTFYAYDNNGNYFVNYEEKTINAQNPVASYTFEVPADTYMYSGYNVKLEGSSSTISSASRNRNVASFSSTQSDFSLAIGATKTASYSGNYVSYLTKSFESSNTEVATVDNNGVVTGVAAGVATITARYGTLVDTFNVRVYDESTMVQANLSLSAPETLTEWPWSGKGQLIVTADQPVENLGNLSQVQIYSFFYDAEGVQVGNQSQYYSAAMITDNQVEIDIETTNMSNYVEDGAVSVRFALYNCSGSGFAIDSAASAVEMPMQALADHPDPMLEVSSPSSTSMVSGKEYTMSVHAVNYALSEPVTVVAYTTISSTRYDLGSVTFTPSESTDATLTITAPSGVTATGFYLYAAQQNADGTETQIGSYYYCSLTPLPTLTTVTTLAELQSAHNYANNINLAWAYTVEGATSLSVTFDSQTRTESTNYDPLKVGSLASFETGSLENTYGGSIGAITVDVTGDTVVIWLKSDSSSTYYGFAVTQIVATMEDGSTVTITE